MMKYRIYCTSKFKEELCIYCHLFFPLQFCNLKIYCVSVQGFCSVNLHSSFLMIQMQIFLVLTFIVLKDLHNYKGMLWAIFLNGARVPKVRQKKLLLIKGKHAYTKIRGQSWSFWVSLHSIFDWLRTCITSPSISSVH